MIKRLVSKETLLLSMMPLLASILMLLVAQTSLYTKVNAWLSDTQQYLFAKEMYFEDVVFIDIDDASLFELEEDLGVWPYKRDVYALVLDYLTAKGANTVVFDLLLSESREGDQALAQIVQQHNNALFIASSPVYASQRQYQGAAHERLLEQIAWQVSSQLPATQLNKLILPNRDFIVTEQGQGNVGVVDILVDPDGTFRRIPALYRVGEHFFPSIPLLLLQKELKQKQWLEQQKRRQRGEYLQDNLPTSLLSYTGLSFDVDKRVISQGDQHWPVDDNGMFSLYFPKNANSVLSMSFYPVVQAAKGQFKPNNEDTFFQNKTVFISSTAFKSDLVNTPRGMMSGSYFLAIVYQNLKHNLLLKAPQQWLNGVLLAIALLPLCLFPLLFRYTPGRHLLLLLTSVALIWILNSTYLALAGQQSILLLPLLILGSAYFLQSTTLAKLSVLRNERLSQQARDLEESNEELALAANTDTLTQLLNRRACLERFESLIEQYKHQQQSFAVAIIDLDHFKAVNDNYGHDIGDHVLKVFAEQICSSKRQHDIAARWGGEEFVLLLPGVDAKQAEMVLERLRHNTSEMQIDASGELLKITVSIGVAQFSDKFNSAEEAVAQADRALYEAKARGRNQICLAADVTTV